VDLRTTGVTRHPLFVRILLAQKFNLITGAQVRPWEIDDIPGEWLLAIEVMANETQAETGRQNANQVVDAYFAARRAAHPTYRKYVH